MDEMTEIDKLFLFCSFFCFFLFLTCSCFFRYDRRGKAFSQNWQAYGVDSVGPMVKLTSGSFPSVVKLLGVAHELGDKDIWSSSPVSEFQDKLGSVPSVSVNTIHHFRFNE